MPFKRLLLAALMGSAIIAPAAASPAAKAQVMMADGTNVGLVALRQTESGTVWISISLSGLPAGVHSFHIHETGKCAPDFKAAGGHFNPTGVSHGVKSKDGPHAGDFPNILVAKDGTASIDYFSDKITLDAGAKNSIFDDDGSSIMIHSGVDDYSSQPAGAAGDRIACGVIEKTGDTEAAADAKK